MKRIILTSALAIFILCANAQEKKGHSKCCKKIVVPESVKKAFSDKYPDAKKVKWDLEKPGQYEAEFKIAKLETSVLIDENGTILEVETEISKKALPEAVQNTLKTDFAGYEIEEVEKIDANGVIKYEMEAEKGKEEFELVFDANGKLISKEVEKD
jgi:uncharacterized membrane protein YkoI